MEVYVRQPRPLEEGFEGAVVEVGVIDWSAHRSGEYETPVLPYIPSCGTLFYIEHHKSESAFPSACGSAGRGVLWEAPFGRVEATGQTLTTLYRAKSSLAFYVL